MMGIYYLFTIDGDETEIVVCNVANSIMDYSVYIGAGGVAVIVLIVIIICKRRKKKKKKSVPVTEKSVEN